jgi:hypothetical protein
MEYTINSDLYDFLVAFVFKFFMKNILYYYFQLIFFAQNGFEKEMRITKKEIIKNG